MFAVLQLAFKVPPLPFPCPRYVVFNTQRITHSQDLRTRAVFMVCKPPLYLFGIADIMPRMV
jgi:hypothetical protein